LDAVVDIQILDLRALQIVGRKPDFGSSQG
jgi:hypothetical protein